MNILYQIHRVFGEQILPLLIVAVAIFLTVTWKQGAPRSPVARFFPILVDIQATLGLLYFILLLMQGDQRLFTFPLILHPLLGLLAAGVGHMAVGTKGPFVRLGRWAPLAGLVVLLVIVIGSVLIARSV
jgi:hypothetical protein